MARKVFISSDMSQDEQLIDVAETNQLAALLWPWLLTAFDDWGRAKASTKRLKASIFPMLDMVTVDDIERALQDFARVGLIVLYEVDGQRYMAVPEDKWYKYQTHMKRTNRRPGKDKMESDFPPPPDIPHEPPRGFAGDCGVPRLPHGDSRGGAGNNGDPWCPVPSPSPSPPSLLPSRDLNTNNNDRDLKALVRNLEPVSDTSQSSSSNDKDKNQEIPFSNPGGIEGTEMSGDGKKSSAGGFQTSPEPELGRLARLYEEEGFGPITETVKEKLIDLYDEFGATWVAEAMREAVLQNKRRLKYVVGILENWRREGGMRRSDGSKGAATDAKAPRRSRADPEPVGRYIPDGPPEDPELDEFLRKAGFFDVPGVNC